jgi:hypothetical protein
VKAAADSLPDLDSPETARAGASLFAKLAEEWGLTRAEQATLLGLRSTTTLDNWRRSPPRTLGIDTLERISYLLHIWRSLHQVFPAGYGLAWLRASVHEAPFLGRTPLEFMLQGRVRDLLDTHRYLKGVASGAF